MRKTKEVLRLKFEVGLGLRQIARSCSIGLGTVHEYLQRAEAAGVTWPLGEDWDEDRLEAALFGGPPRARPAVLPMPDFAELHQQRQRASTPDSAVAVGGIPAGQPGWLSLFAILRTLSALALETRCGAASGAQSRRESFRRLGGSNDSGV